MPVVKTSRLAFTETVGQLTHAITGAGNTVFATIDQAAAAQTAGLALRPTTLIVFGNPKAGTILMDAVPLAALDLPLKFLVWENGGTVSVAYTTAAELAERYAVTGKDALIEAMDAALAKLLATVSA
jgi:uncharacterized protein (DUF302 family)